MTTPADGVQNTAMLQALLAAPGATPAAKAEIVSIVFLAQVLGLKPAEGENGPMFFLRVREASKRFATPEGETLHERVFGSND